jgi:hypothetical protein
MKIIKAYVARDLNGNIFVHSKKPVLDSERGIFYTTDCGSFWFVDNLSKKFSKNLEPGECREIYIKVGKKVKTKEI